MLSHDPPSYDVRRAARRYRMISLGGGSGAAMIVASSASTTNVNVSPPRETLTS